MGDLGGRFEDEQAGVEETREVRVGDSIYIAGPMRGIKWYNFPAFDAAYAYLLMCERPFSKIVSPANMDRAAGFDPMNLPPDHDWNTLPEGFDWDACVKRDIEAVASCDSIYMLSGWEKSEGATAEHTIAKWLRKEVLYAEGALCAGSQQRTNPTEGPAAGSGEIRVTDPVTGGQKGQKEARYDLIPPEILHRLAIHYGRGARKYADDNYRKGYRWKLSIGALQRHLGAFLRGESIDAETGSHHLVAVMWHAITLQEFERLGLGTDDRYCTTDTPRTCAHAAECCQ